MRSISRVCICRATSTASASLRGRSRECAKRFPVPAGTTPIGIPLLARPFATMRTVPSPPAAMTRSTFASTARAAIECPGSCSVVSSQIGSSQAVGTSCRLTVVRKSSDTFVGLKITAHRRRSGCSATPTPHPPKATCHLSCQTPACARAHAYWTMPRLEVPEGTVDRDAASQRANSLRTRPIRSELPTASRLTTTMAA